MLILYILIAIPVTMEAKLSSINIISAASFATSEPDIPIANPTSAILSAGASKVYIHYIYRWFHPLLRQQRFLIL